MRTSSNTIDLVLGQLSTFEKLYGAVMRDEDGRLIVSTSAKEDIIRDAREITDTCDTAALPPVLIPAASAIGDAAYLLANALDAAEEVTVDKEKTQEPKVAELRRFFKPKNQTIEKLFQVDEQSYCDAGDYARKGRELLRSPARDAGIEIKSTLA